MQTKGSSLKNQWFCSFRDHYHKSVPILVARGKMSPSPHSARVLTDTTHVRGEGLGSLDVQIRPGRLKWGERQTTWRARRMGFPQEEKSSPGTHRIRHIRAPKHGSHKHTQGTHRAKTPEQLRRCKDTQEIRVKRERAAPQEIQPVE